MHRFNFYQYSCLIWGINVIFVFLSYFVSVIGLPVVIFLIAVFISYGAMVYLEKRKEHFGLDRIFKYSTNWSKIIAFLSIVYTVVNFAVCTVLLSNGSPHIQDGVYCLWNHGFIREITKEEYDALLIVEGRLLTGHCLTFSAIPVAYFSAIKNILNSLRQ